MDPGKKELLDILRTKSISYGEFVLSSGKKSPYYVDVKSTTGDARGVTLAGKIVFELIKGFDQNITAVGGLTMGADPITTSTIIEALEENRDIKGFWVRKEPKSHGKRKLIEGNLDESDNVIILDDVITTGNSTIKAIKAVKEFGAKIVAVIALVDRLEGGKENISQLGYNVFSLFTIDDLLDVNKINKGNNNGSDEEFTFINEKRILQKEFN